MRYVASFKWKEKFWDIGTQGQSLLLPHYNSSGGSRISHTGGGAPTSKVGAKTYYFAKFSPKTAWKWKNLDPRVRVPSAPLRPATVIQKLFIKIIWQNISCECQFVISCFLYYRNKHSICKAFIQKFFDGLRTHHKIKIIGLYQTIRNCFFLGFCNVISESENLYE